MLYSSDHEVGLMEEAVKELVSKSDSAKELYSGFDGERPDLVAQDQQDVLSLKFLGLNNL